MLLPPFSRELAGFILQLINTFGSALQLKNVMPVTLALISVDTGLSGITLWPKFIMQ